MVTIPCGKCVTFDEDHGEMIILDLGLSIVGKLVFPPDTKATIETPFIFVQGKLEASSNAIETVIMALRRVLRTKLNMKA